MGLESPKKEREIYRNPINGTLANKVSDQYYIFHEVFLSADDYARMDHSNRDHSRNVWSDRLRGNSNDYYNARSRS